MANSKATIVFNSDLAITDILQIFVRGDIDQDWAWNWVALRSAAFEVTKGTPTATPGEADALTFKTAFDLDVNLSSDFTTVVTSNELVITATSPDVTFLNIFSIADITVTIENALIATDYVNVNSPYFLTAPIYNGTQLIDPLNVDFDVKIWTGDVVTDKPSVNSYTYQKAPKFLGDRSIYISIDKQIRDFIEHDYDGTLSAESVFVEYVNTTTYNDGTEKTMQNNNVVIGLDGYNSFKDGTSPTLSDLLISNRHISVLSGENINIPFYKGGDSYTVTSRTGTTVVDTQNITSIQITDSTTAVEYLSFVSTDINNIRIVNDDTLEEIIISVEVVTECTYEPIKCVFINSFGVKQEFYFFKSNKENASFKNESYKRNILSTNVVDNKIVVSYDTNKHTNKVYNKQGQKSIDVNSGYIDEDNNILIEELLMSEYVWLVVDSIIYPVDVDTKSLEYQTRLNDQLIKYKLKFKYSFDIKQNIR